MQNILTTRICSNWNEFHFVNLLSETLKNKCESEYWRCDDDDDDDDDDDLWKLIHIVCKISATCERESRPETRNIKPWSGDK